MTMLENSSSRDPLSIAIIVRRVLQPALAVMSCETYFLYGNPENYIPYFRNFEVGDIFHSPTVDLHQVNPNLSF